MVSTDMLYFLCIHSSFSVWDMEVKSGWTENIYLQHNMYLRLR
jgi:hypothetical protein